MKRLINFSGFRWLFTAGLILTSGSLLMTRAQDRLKDMPGYAQYQKMSPLMRGTVKQGSLQVTWKDDSKTFEYQWDGKKYSYDVKKLKATELGAVPAETGPGGPGGRMGAGGRQGMQRSGGERPQRGRQYTSALSPDGKLKAMYKDHNLFLGNTDGSGLTAITTDGTDKNRIKYGTASWVYGEELGQVTAMWWSPDGKKLAFYRFDESKVLDFYLQYNQLLQQDSVEIEPYTKVGANNPVVDILVYDLQTKKITKLDVRDGKPFETKVVGHYIYGVEWTPDGTELLFHRTNRKQDIMELAAASPETGKCRVVIHEEWLPSFTENSPMMQYLKDNKHFIWVSERTGFKNFYLYDLSGQLLVTLTNHPFEVANIVKVDEEGGFLYYMARDGENHMKLQLHKVGLDGKGDVRLTDPAYLHSVTLSPNNKYFTDVVQTHNIPPSTRLVNIKGKILAELAKSDMTKFDDLGLKKVEMITFTAADGKTQLHGLLQFPTNFDPSKKYPVLVTVYGGPATNAATERFATPGATTEYGFLVASFDSRSAAGRGKRFMDPFYGHLGIVEMDDQAEGVKSLFSRPYVNREKVGIYGTSYGGTSSATCLLRFPDVFHAACANSAVTDYRNYDNIYAERNMGLLEDNKAGYDSASIMTYAGNLKGHLMIYYGTSDNNVHPSNSLQLITALQKARKSFEVQVGPDRGHTAVDAERMMEFFIENLVLR
ncbi:MAG: DPP IV N-terminal domain-containing protein [Bacteroidales bacterium]